MLRRSRRALGALATLLLASAGAVPAHAATAAAVDTGGGALTALGAAPGLDGPDLATAHPVAVAATPDGTGVWVATADGGVHPFGEAPFRGSLEGVALTQPIVDFDPTPSGEGYWLLGADGGVFTFGDAAFHGSTGDLTLNAPVVGLVPTPTGDGYWLVARDGGIFTFGDAAFHGSTGGIRINAPIVDAAATPTGDGYWLAAADGAVFTFGDAAFHGSAGAVPLQAPVVAMAPTAGGDGYWLLGRDGGIFTYGAAAFPGAAPIAPGRYAVDLAPTRDGDGVWVASTPQPPRVSVGPALPSGSRAELGRRVVYSNSAQRVWLVGADGVVEHSHAVSGRRGVPGPGVYRVWSRSPVAWAGHDGITMRLMVRFAWGAGGGNIGFHTIPTFADGRPLQTEAELGRYRSAGCVRQGEADARIMWDWAQLGTTVEVLP